MSGAILVANTTVQATIDGSEVLLVAGKTTVREGHPILAGREALFEPLRPVYEVEQQAVKPKAPAKPADKTETGSA